MENPSNGLATEAELALARQVFELGEQLKTSLAGYETRLEQRTRERDHAMKMFKLTEGERDAAEERFVRAREEASELEQEMADLRNELAFVKRRRDEAMVNRTRCDTRLFVLTGFIGAVFGMILQWALA